MAEFIKGTAFSNYKYVLTDANSPTIGLTGLSPSVEIANDAGTFSSALGSSTELQSGWYIHSSIVTSEMNHDSLVFVAMASGANDYRDVIYPKIFSTTDIKSDGAHIVANLPTNFTDLAITASDGLVSVASLNVPADITATTMSSLNSLIFTDPLSKYEGSTGRNLARAVAFLVNFKDFSGDDLQVKKSDDSTNFYTIATSGDSAADPIVAMDPS
jgi:hypothetical protein